MTDTKTAQASTFYEEVVAEMGGFGDNLQTCLQCGTCSGSCPSGPDMDHSPRKIFAMINAGMKDEVLSSNTPWYCVSCYYCMVRCPQEIHITDVMYALKRMAIRDGNYQKSKDKAPEFSETFIDFVENYGRSFELGLATRYHLRYQPVEAFKMATGMGLKLFTKGRMDIIPTRIKNLDQLKAILGKAKELGGKV